MKKTSARCINKRRDKEDREEEGEDNVESSSSIHLGVKMELQGHVEGSDGVVEEVVEAPWDEITDTTLVDLTQQFNKVFVQTTFNSFKGLYYVICCGLYLLLLLLHNVFFLDCHICPIFAYHSDHRLKPSQMC